MSAALWIQAVQVRPTDGASPVKSAECDCGDYEEEGLGIWNLLGQPGQRGGDGGRDAKHDEKNGDR